MNSNSPYFQFNAIGIVHSCFNEKFGTPRQPGLVPEATARIELLPPYNRIESVVGLEEFSHLWVQFVFHQCLRDGWKPMVKPPRLGGKEKVGVFASRSPYRPNPIGLSVVELVGVEQDKQTGVISIVIRGADIIDGTPVLDIKPYISYSDKLENTRDGFAPEAPALLGVELSDQAEGFCAHYNQAQNFKTLVIQVLQLDPRPAYYKDRIQHRVYGLSLLDCEIKWVFRKALNDIYVEEIVRRDND